MGQRADRPLPQTAKSQPSAAVARACQALTPTVRAMTTHDIDEQAALLIGWNQTYDQISAGPFNGSFFEADVGRASLFREITSNSLHQSGALAAQTIAIGVPITLRGQATFCGQRCDGMQLHIFSGNEAFEFFSPSGLDIVGFVMTEHELRSGLNEDEAHDVLATLAAPHLRSVHRDASDHVRRIFLDAHEIALQHPDRLADPLLVASMARDLRSTIISALACRDGDCVDASPSKRAHIVKDAHDLVTDWPERYASVEELCKALGVSRRTIQLSFQETLGLKPTAYLRAVRLNGARRAIKEARSVAEAATLWGFWHFGRFAHDYQSMFGERPSDTFRRHHATWTT